MGRGPYEGGMRRDNTVPNEEPGRPEPTQVVGTMFARESSLSSCELSSLVMSSP